METRLQLDQAIDQLAANLPGILGATREECQMEAFAGMADEVLEHASPKDREHIWSRLQCILRDNGLIPGDDEACDDN